MYSVAEDDIFFKKKIEDKIESGRVLKQPSSRWFPVSHEKGGIEGIVRLTCDGFLRQCRCHCASAWRGSKTRWRKLSGKGDYRPQFSKSRTMTATWARLAASATRVKSLRKTSVEGFLRSWGGGAGAEAIWLGDVRSEEAAAVEEAPP